MNRIYCDISATTPLDPHVARYMSNLQQDTYGNPSSIHREGQAAKSVIEKSRRQIAQVLNSQPDNIIFTSSGTESNNMILKGVLKAGDHFITSSYEHPAILKVLPYLKKKGIDFSLVKPDNKGIVNPESVEKEIQRNTKLISIMYVNNELGTINPIKEIANLVKEKSILFHSDAVQALGKISLDMHDITADFLSFSAHKLYGPKGCGALFIRKGSNIEPLIYGGGQESNLRGSTENIIGIGGFGLAAELSAIGLDENTENIMHLESNFIDQLNNSSISYKINGDNRIPGVMNITFYEIDGKNLVMQLDMLGIGISFGAACASGTMQTSNMLLDMGLTKSDALSTVRISFGKIHSKKDVDVVTKSIESIINKSSNKELVNV